MAVFGLASVPTASAGSLQFFEAAGGPGVPVLIAPPANAVLLDLKYDASSAEGGTLYGFSEVLIATTGDVTFDSSGFFCLAAECIFAPLPFVSGTEILVTAGDDLPGESGSSTDLMSIAVSGTNGQVAVIRGAYVDSTGDGGTPGAIRAVNTTLLASVPEPGVGIALACGFLGLTAARRRRDVQR